MPNEARNGYKKLFDKLVYKVIMGFFLGIIGLGIYNFQCDAQRAMEAKEAREKLEIRQEKKVEKLESEIKEDIAEIKESQKEMKQDMKDGFKEIKKLVRKIK